MSDDNLLFVPSNPLWLPVREAAEAATACVRSIAPYDDGIKADGMGRWPARGDMVWRDDR